MRSLKSLFLAGALLAAACGAAPAAVRVKDVARVDGVRRNQLIGYGVVVGLNGTGDSTSSVEVTRQTTANLLERLGVSVPPRGLRTKNVASVMVTADLPAFGRAGQRVDVTVSSMGDAKSLLGGTLLLTPLRAPNGDVYAAAQGPMAVGGYSTSAAGSSTQKNHPTAGRIPDGAVLERDSPLPVLDEDHLDLVLDKPDFTTASRLATALNSALGGQKVQAVDAGRVRIATSEHERADPVTFLSVIEGVTLEPDVTAKVVLDEKNGTVVLGQDVKVRPVAIAQGDLTVQVTRRLETSQPNEYSRGRTVARNQADIATAEQPARLVLLDQGENLSSLVQALNSLGVTPRDLVTILQTLRAAGALEAEITLL